MSLLSVSVMARRLAQHPFFVYLPNIYLLYIYCLYIYRVNIYNASLLAMQMFLRLRPVPTDACALIQQRRLSNHRPSGP